MIGGHIGTPIGGVLSDESSVFLGAATLTFAGQPFSVVLPVTAASLQLAGQAQLLDRPLIVDPASLAFEGVLFEFRFIIVAEGNIRFQGQEITLSPLTPSRNRGALKLPRPDASLTGRLASYWRGMRN